MSIGIYCDVHISRAIADGLRARGVRVILAQEDSADRLSDPALLDRATELGYILFTHDDDLLIEANRRDKAGEQFTGVVFSRMLSSPIGRCIEDLEIIANAFDVKDLENIIEYIPF